MTGALQLVNDQRVNNALDASWMEKTPGPGILRE